MTFRRFAQTLLLAALPVVASLPVSAAVPTQAKVEPSVDKSNIPNLLSLGAGWYDFTPNTPRKEAIDFRIEHRWGLSLLPLASSYFNGWNKYFQIHPFAGVETTSRAQFYGFGGFVFDVLLGDHVVLSPNVAVGIYDRGDGKRLGSFVEFRSAVEGGWRFDNEMRLTAYISHTSNAGLTDLNPGANTIGGYVHIPTRILFGE